MTPKVSIIMGSTSDMAVMETAARLLDEFGIPFEMNALSAHRTLAEVDSFARSAKERGILVIIAAAGMAAHLPGVVASLTPLPVIGVPIKASLEGIDALFSIVQMPPGVPVATVAVNGALNSALLAIRIMAVSDNELMQKLIDYIEGLKDKIVKANKEISQVKYKYKTN